MKRSLKLSLAGGALILAVVALSSCTADFCTKEEKSRMLFAVEPGVSVYYDSQATAEAARQDTTGEHYQYIIEQVYDDNPNLWRSVEIDVTSKNAFTKSKELSSIINSASNNGTYRPTNEYFTKLDTKVLSAAAALGNISTKDLVAGSDSDETINAINKQEVGCTNNVDTVLTVYGHTKFFGDNNTLWVNYTLFLNELRTELGEEACPSNDFIKTYESTMSSAVSGSRSCIATVSGSYGSYGQDDSTVFIQEKSWAYAWNRGFIEGLLVYPVAWLVDSLTIAFGGVSAAGWAQLLALVVVTLIVRLFVFACTFKSTMEQQKMQGLQPELAKIQAKYPNANTNQAEKQRLSQEQMALYKKNKINPLSQLIVIAIQFPVFIAVWGAMTGSSVLSTGSFLGLKLSTSIWSALSNFTNWPSAGWWTALVLFLLMAASQFVSMKLPQWITKARNKNVQKLGKNPAQDTQGKTMKIVSYAMLAMIIFMGFTLPAAMGVYWLVGALISVIQTGITQAILARPIKRRKK